MLNSNKEKRRHVRRVIKMLESSVKYNRIDNVSITMHAPYPDGAMRVTFEIQAWIPAKRQRKAKRQTRNKQ